MDWDTDFGFGRGVDHYGKNVVYPQRTMDEIKTFDLKEFVRKQKQEKLKNAGMDGNSSPMGGGSPFGMNPFGGGMPGGMPGMGSDMDIDKMIKEIDAKIAELEKEEEEEKKKQEAEKNNKDAKKSDDQSKDVSSAEEKLFNTRNISENPKIDEVLHSNMVDFNNFKVKEDKKEEQKKEVKTENNNQEVKQEQQKDNNKTSSEYDDFFDDFFFEE